jgi:hypothetical protein
MRNVLRISGLASLAIVGTAQAQTVQTNAYGSDIAVSGTWQDLVVIYGAMANSTAWVANKSGGSIVVVFTPSATAPTGGGTILPPNSAPLFGSAAHVWVRALGGGPLVISAGLGAAVTSSGGSSVSAAATAAIPSYSSGAQSLSLDLSGQLRTRTENGANVAVGSTADSAWQGSGAGTAIGLLKTIATAALDTTSTTTIAVDTSNPGVSNVVMPTCRVATVAPSYTNGALQPFNCTTAGQLKVATAGLNSATSVSTIVAAATSSSLLLATNAARTGGNVVNDSSAVMYLKLSAGASSISYDYYLAGSVGGIPAQFEIPIGWTGPIYAAWSTSAGSARVSERSQ